jgi:trimeric autotransporter adhesin
LESLLVFTIQNLGGTDLTGINATFDGEDAGMFSIVSTPAASLAHNGSCTFTVKFRPTSAGTKTALLRIASNAPARNPYEIHLAGDALFSDQDADDDGMNDASEFRLAAMGFNWQQPQTDLVNTYYTHAGLNGLYTRDQVRAIRISRPQLEKSDGDGQFKMSLRILESADLENFSPLPLLPSAVHVDEDGRLECEFEAADTEEFYWLESE